MTAPAVAASMARSHETTSRTTSCCRSFTEPCAKRRVHCANDEYHSRPVQSSQGSRSLSKRFVRIHLRRPDPDSERRYRVSETSRRSSAGCYYRHHAHSQEHSPPCVTRSCPHLRLRRQNWNFQLLRSADCASHTVLLAADTLSSCYRRE